MEQKSPEIGKRLLSILLFGIGALALGILTGLVGCAFDFATLSLVSLRSATPLLIILLPVGGLLITLLYRVFKYEKDPGVNAVIDAINADGDVPIRVAPLIFIAACFSHFCGASVGRVGTTLQVGGSLGNFFANIFKLSKEHKKTIIMCGMSGVFSAMFGTPLTGALFSLEMSTVGIIPFSALPFTLITSYTARFVGQLLGFPNAEFTISEFPKAGPESLLPVALLAAICGLLTILYCFAIQNVKDWFSKLIKNVYVRNLVFGCILVVLMMVVGSDAMGLGVNIVRASFESPAIPGLFILKILFTCLSFTAGYKGGEVYPALFVGATFGSFFAGLFGLPTGFAAALGMGAMFCGITNCPITSFFLCLELFGGEGAVYYILVIAVTWLASGYFGIFKAQKFAFSKYTFKKF